MIIEDVIQQINLESYTESKTFAGYVDLENIFNEESMSTLHELAGILFKFYTDGCCLLSSLYFDKNCEASKNKQFMREFILPLADVNIVKVVSYENWSDNDQELLDFELIKTLTTEQIYKILFVYLVMDAYLLYGHIFFASHDFAFYVSDEGVGAFYFNENGQQLATKLLETIKCIKEEK